MALKGEQKRILAEILRQGSQVRDPDKRRRYTRAAVQTGLVESNLRNLSYGDADSQGWRQERASLYPNPTNVKASVRRFFAEARQHDQGQPSWELAADVQRPAAQYRGRYREVAKQAQNLITGQGGVRGGGRTGTTRTASSSGIPATDLSAGGAAGLLSALQAISQPQQQTQVSIPSPPSFSAQAALPAGYQAPQTSGAPQQQQSGIGEALQQISQITGGDLDVLSGLRTRGRAGTRARGGGQVTAGGVNLRPRGSFAGTTGPVNQLAKLANRVSGLKVTSGKRSTVSTASGGVSDHYQGNKTANARDISGTPAQMDRAAVAIARALGIKGYKKGDTLVANVNRRGIRYQILYRTNVGGDHYDHIHVGARRL